jgi:hypothetical protein
LDDFDVEDRDYPCGVGSAAAMKALARILMWVEVGFIPLFLTLAFFRIGTRARAVGFLAALTVFPP